jgi:hypothetical protein
MAVGTAISAGAAIQQGEQQKDWNNYQADQAAADSKADRDIAMIQADKIRKLAKKQASEATAALAASGVDVGEGTAVKINEEIIGNAEEDAVMTIFGGADRANRGLAESSAYRTRGQQAQNAGHLNAGSSLLSGGYEYSKWKKQK